MNQSQHELGPFNYDFEQHVRSGKAIDIEVEPLNLQIEKSLKIIGQHFFQADMELLQKIKNIFQVTKQISKVPPKLILYMPHSLNKMQVN